MLIHFQSTSSKKDAGDIVVNIDDNNKFESFITRKIKDFFMLSFDFTEDKARETHDNEETARKRLKEILDQLGFKDQSQEISSNVRFTCND